MAHEQGPGNLAGEISGKHFSECLHDDFAVNVSLEENITEDSQNALAIKACRSTCLHRRV
ncbi:hypothetical protein D2E23_0143 [Bifidobacterium callimiconis]|uniref:Uncharacterized protein n=1 Tax=Bifidobacterium callimiconis TaxID=2306973 RepID=A0A430FHN4_9BIFI|nr:hypothetical protein D2E23_0143 [Bifidobacterium callimiconis]